MSDETPDPTTDDGTEALVVDLSAPLPDFEGRTPVGVLTSLQGAGQRIVRALHNDEEVILVVRTKVVNVAHPMTKEGMKRSHTLKVDDMYELPGRIGTRLLGQCAKAYRLADDSRHGRTALEGLVGEGDGIEVTTDGAGVVLTPEDRAALGLDDRGSDAVVVVFGDGARALWPDDWGRHPIERPTAGESVVVPGGGDDLVLVRRLLDPVTGETVAEFTESDAERAEAVQAAAEDRAAAYELEQGRMENRAPFDGYDDADVQLIKMWLDEDCEKSIQAHHVELYEGAHKQRKTVLAAAEGRRAYLFATEQQAEQRAELERLVVGYGDDSTGFGEDLDLLVDEELPPLPGETGGEATGWDVVSATDSVIWSNLPTEEEAQKEADRLNASDRKTGKPFRVEEVDA